MKFKIFSIFFIGITVHSFSQPKLSRKERIAQEKLAAQIKAAHQVSDLTIEANLKQHIYLLASDSLQGRRTGTNGEAMAVHYIAEQYKKIGLQPMGDNNSFVQAFNVNEGLQVLPSSFVKANGNDLVLNDDYWPFSFSPNKRFTGNATWGVLEYGEPFLYDLKEILQKNKSNPHFDLIKHLQDKAKELSVKKVKALLVYNTSELNDSLAFTPLDHGETTAIPSIYFTKLGIKKLMSASSIANAIDANIELGEKTRKGHNVVAFLNNNAPTTIVLGGHLDHLGMGEDHNSRNTGAPAIHNGADDNASGTSAVVELARLLKNICTETNQNATPIFNTNDYKNNNYLFVNFSGEELGLFGSKYIVEHFPQPMENVNYMINMDMIGRLTDSTHSLTIGGVGSSPAWGQALQTQASTEFAFKLDSSGTGPSDHTSFYRKNIPVLFFFTGLHSDYHKPSDDAEKINYTGETQIVDYILKVISRANSMGKLAFTKTKEQSVGSGRFRVSIGIMPDYAFAGQGVRADGIVDGKAAQKAGLQTGDIIVQLGEHLVTGLETYMQALNKFSKGDTTKVLVKRGTEIKEFPVTF